MCDVRAGQAAVRLIESEAGIGNSRLILSPIGDAGNAAANQIRAMIPCQGSGPPRTFRTALFALFHAASCRFRYSSWASCGVM